MRQYKQYCGVAKALDVVGERWTLLIVRDLLLGPRRYTDLRLALPGLTTNLLARRLRHLEEAGLIGRVALPPPASGEAYQLTQRGLELEPVVLALGRFGARYLAHRDPTDRVDLRWGLVSLRRRYLGGLSGRLEIIAAGVPYTVDLYPDRLTSRDGSGGRADVRIEGPTGPVMQVVLGGLSPVDLPVQVSGDATLLEALAVAIGARPEASASPTAPGRGLGV